MNKFDDYLQLEKQDYSTSRYIIFYGESGSGKSRYSSFLAKNNPSLQQKTFQTITPHISNIDKNISSKYLIIDEILNIKTFFQCFPLFFSAKQLIIASHLPKGFFIFLRIFGKISFYTIDTHAQKIANYLQNHGYSYNKEDIQIFIQKYSANYTDLEIVLEKSSSKNFGKILERFEQYGEIEK